MPLTQSTQHTEDNMQDYINVQQHYEDALYCLRGIKELGRVARYRRALVEVKYPFQAERHRPKLISRHADLDAYEAILLGQLADYTARYHDMPWTEMVKDLRDTARIAKREGEAQMKLVTA